MTNKISQEELEEMCAKHCLWLQGQKAGQRAYFDGLNLENLRLSAENLSRASFQGTVIRGCDFSGTCFDNANFDFAIIENTNLHSAHYKEVSFSKATAYGTSFRFAYFADAQLSDSSFSRSDFFCAKIRKSDLSRTFFGCSLLNETDFSGSRLYRTNFNGANLAGASLETAEIDQCEYDEATSFFALQCPETGSFIGYKKAEDLIVKLLIPARAKRSSGTSRKCRCSEAKVLGIYNQKGKKSSVNIVRSTYDSYFVYKVGEIVRVKNFDANRWNECSTGIHFFLTFEEAKQYND